MITEADIEASFAEEILGMIKNPQYNTNRDILYGICNTRDADLPLFQRELKAYLLRRGVMHQREPHDSPSKPP